MVLLFWTIRKLAEGRIDEVDFSPEYEGTADQVRRLLIEKKAPRVSEIFEEARAVGVFQLVACSARLEYMGVDPDAVTKQVDSAMGLPAFLALASSAETTLFNEAPGSKLRGIFKFTLVPPSWAALRSAKGRSSAVMCG